MKSRKFQLRINLRHFGVDNTNDSTRSPEKKMFEKALRESVIKSVIIINFAFKECYISNAKRAQKYTNGINSLLSITIKQ